MEKSQNQTEDGIETEEDSQILKLGQAALYRSESNSQTTIVSEKSQVMVEHVAAKPSFMHLVSV